MTERTGGWDAPGFGLAPAAALVGPFPHRGFLEAWWRHRGAGEPLIVASETALVAARRLAEGTVEFMGEPDLTDYHSPLGADAASLICDLAVTMAPGTRMRFDSLPEEAAEVVAAGLSRAGVAVRREQHAVAVVLDLPASREEYLAGLDAKERHEVRRKRRRFEAALGPGRLVRGGREGLAAFAAMHRAAAGAKGGFLTGELEAFFADLLDLPGAGLDLLVAEDGRPVAGAFGFRDEQAYYLYNSACQPAAAGASPGVVLVDLRVERASAAGLSLFDFLKVEEPYKYRLGGRARPLFVVEGVR